MYKEHFRTPGYPVLISLFLLFNDAYTSFLLFQVFLGAIIPVLLYFIAIELKFYRRTAFIAAILLAVDLPSVIFASTILSDTFFVFLFLLGTWLLLLGKTQNKMGLLLFSGLIIGFAALTRPIGLFLPILLAFFLMPLRSPLKLLKLGIFLIFSYGLIFTWIYRNDRVFGFKFLSTVPMANGLYYRAAEVYGEKNNISLQQARQKLEQQVILNLNKVKSKDYKQNLKNGIIISNKLTEEILFQSPFTFLRQSSKHAMMLLIKPARAFIDQQLGFKMGTLQHDQLGVKNIIAQTSITALALSALQLIFLTLTWLAFCVGLFLLLQEKKYMLLSILILLILYFVILSAGPEADARLRLPFIPFVCLIAAKGLEKIRLPSAKRTS